MFKKIILLLILVQFSTLSYSQYKWINPLPQGNNLYSVCFVNNYVGFAVGHLGTILKTTNRGKDWNIIKSNTSQTLRCIYFIDDYNGFIVGDLGTILRTNNQGNDWEPIINNLNTNLYSVFFTNNTDGFACGNDGVIIKTTDGGDNWELSISNVNGGLLSIDFPTSETGYIVGEYGIALKTNDAGLSWTVLTDFPEKSMYSTEFITDSIGYITGYNNFIYKTEDGGNSWINLNDTITDYPTRSIRFINDQVGFVCGDNGLILKTENGGQSWDKIDSNTNSRLFNIDIINDSSLCIVGELGIMLVSHDYGNSFSEVYIGTRSNFYSIFKFDYSHYRVCGKKFLETTNGGATWETTNSYNPLAHIQFLNSSVGFATNLDRIWKTTDGGLTWTQIYFNNLGWDWISGICMINESHGFAFGGGYDKKSSWGTLWETTNGVDWTYGRWGNFLDKVYFKDTITGFIFLRHVKEIYISQDGGDSWTSHVLPNISYEEVRYDDIYFPEDSIGFLICHENHSITNTILKTTDGGYNWEVVFEDHDWSNFTSIHFYDNLNGYIVGEGGRVMQTTDGGISWIAKSKFTNIDLKDVLMVNDSSGYIAGYYGTLVSFGEINTGIEDKYHNPQSINPFPNPFNENINFEIYSNINDKVTIEIFEINGRLVASESKIIENGNQTINLNSCDKLPYGTYIYKIKGRKIFYTGKIIKGN